MGVRRPLLLGLVVSMLALAVLFAMRAAQSTVDAERTAEPSSTQQAERKASPRSSGEKRTRPSGKPDSNASAPSKSESQATPSKSGSKATTPSKSEANATTPSQSDSKPKPPRERPSAPTGVPRSIARALAGKRVVVLFFRQPGADDDATAAAVNSLRGRKNVSVFRDHIRRLARYRAIVSGLGISQAPAVVVVGRRRKATLLEGFIDEGSLRQQVADAR